MAHDTTIAVDEGQGTGRASVEVAGQRFRVRTPRFSTQWLPDTPSNRHMTIVWLRLLQDEHGQPCFTLQELAALVGSANRQAASQHLEDFRQCGEGFRAFVLRQRKVNAGVVAGVLKELLATPLSGPTALAARAKVQLVPHVIITNGLPAYACLVPGAKHVLCRFHHQQGVIHWLKQHFATAEEIDARKPIMKKVFQTHDKRTVRRRLAQLRDQAPALGITSWVKRVEAKLPKLLWSVRSVRLPSTTNAIERFFRAFQRFYATSGGFHSVLSAKRELLLFLAVYGFTPRATTGQAPIEVIVPEACRMPLYRLINDPFRALQERGAVKRKPTMADFLLDKVAAA
ncbi:MAG: hypothetical protein ACRERE_30950 [Candidatus Entotheonellia bacterium]